MQCYGCTYKNIYGEQLFENNWGMFADLFGKVFDMVFNQRKRCAEILGWKNTGHSSPRPENVYASFAFS